MFSLIEKPKMNLKILDGEIHIYAMTHTHLPYIFMNNETYNDIHNKCKYANECVLSLDSCVNRYDNCKIYIDNDLTYGVVDLR